MEATQVEKNYRVRDIQIMFDVSRQTVSNWIDAGDLAGIYKAETTNPTTAPWIISSTIMQRLRDNRCSDLQNRIDILVAERDRLLELTF